tara:strand:+ start:182 stop:508 length:327 start_codon:yes stop_codon:yes gene_type:complete
MGRNRDWKLPAIVLLAIVLIGVGSWIGYGFYKARENGLILNGFQQGQVQGQMGVVNAIQTTGYFAFNVADEQGEPQQLVLVGQLATPEQLNQAQRQAQQGQQAQPSPQ